MSPDPYDVLGVPREAQAEDLKAAYRRLVRENHPDVASDKIAATTRMARINQAWQLIGDPHKRLAFDARYRLESFERNQGGRSVASPPPQKGPQRDAREAPGTEKARLEAQRRARLERERLERERARRMRTSGAKSSSKTSSHASSNGKSASRPGQAAAPSAPQSHPKAPDRQGRASREMRLRHKITLAAQLFHRERKVEEAVALCRSVLQADGRSVPARELLGDIYLQQGRVEYALMMFDQALLLAPNNMMLRRKRDQLQNSQDRPKKSPSPAKKPRASLLGRLRARLSRKS